MSEMKFRAWHKGYEKSAIRSYANPAMIYEDKQGDVFNWLNQGQPIEIMQSIGLKDANRIDIYEGDIISIAELADGNSILSGVVTYVPQKACFCVREKDNGYYFDNRAKHWRVIGNIYQNPELL